MDLVVDNVAGLFVIDRVDDFVVSIVFIAIKILSLATVTFTTLVASPKAG